MAETPQENPDSNIFQSDITTQMQKAYLDYAMSVIVSRALPDVRDGLKPVHRRIIYAMQDQSMTAANKFHKCAAVVGEVLKKYHPHGDISVYDALVRMGQDFSMRYPLIIPQGNFGSIDGDNPAAMRYTECKMDKISEELYRDIDKETVNFELNDLQNPEPEYLPSLIPNLLLNGQTGIAVGMATNIPPHNLNEVVDGINYTIDQAETIGGELDEHEIEVVGEKHKIKIVKTDFTSKATANDLINYIQGPDFPTGGIIYDRKEIIQMYATGKGRVVTRAKVDVEETKAGKLRLIVKEIPYQVNKATLIAKIADLVKTKKIDGIVDLRDESSRNELRIMIELRKGTIVKKIENRLYKYTQLQNTFNANMVALINNEPKLMTLKMILEEFVKHRQEVIVKRTIFLFKKAKSREHILKGLKIALDNLDEVIKLIRNSKDADVAKEGLMTRFGLSDIQAQAILDMQLRRLAALERQKIEDELLQIQQTIKDYENLLMSPEKIMGVIKQELAELKEKYGDERKTRVQKGNVGEISEEDLVVNEKCIVTISDNGYIKRLKESTYKTQGRGGKGVTAAELKEEDQVSTIKISSTHDWALFFSDSGKVYKLRVWEIPEFSRKAKGTPIVNFLSISQDEKIQAFLTLTADELENSEGKFIFLATQKGRVKKTELEQFNNIRTSGIIAISLTSDDKLVFADITNGNRDIILTTAQGQSIRFSEEDVRPMGRSAGGVTGIRLKDNEDMVVGAATNDPTSKNTYLLTVSAKGYGKRTTLEEYKVQNRSGSGILTYKVSDKTSELVAARAYSEDTPSDLLIATESGMIIRLDANEVPVLGRATLGVRLIKLADTDKVTSVAVVEEHEDTLTEENKK